MIFDEINSVSEPLRSTLIDEGMAYSTSAEILQDAQDMGSIIARDFDHARERAERRGYGELIMGRIRRQRPSSGENGLRVVV